jgi:GxxExxY protein
LAFGRSRLPRSRTGSQAGAINQTATDDADITLDMETADPTNRIIGLAIKVHRRLGPGLLESVYQECLCWELAHGGLAFKRQVPLPVIYEDVRLNCAYYTDLIVEQSVIVELKSVERILPVHEAQTLTYLRLSACKIGLLMNFNSVMLKDGLRRFIP